MNNKNNSFFAPSEVKSVISYLFINFILGSFVLIFLAIGISLFNNNYSFNDLFTLASLPLEDVLKLPDNMQYMYYQLNIYTNFICYLFGFLFICLFMRNHLSDDFNNFKSKPLIYILFSILCAGIFYFISILVSNAIEQFVGISNNQSLIEGMILNDGAILVFFAVVVFAPLVEELIYRKAIFKLLEKKNIIISYLVSTIVFVLPHMLSTPIDSINDIGKWLLLCVPYFISAIMLCVTYHVSKKNIYTVWFVHMVNNLITFILIAIGG